MIHTKFIHVAALTSSGSLVLGALLVAPSPFDNVLAYEQPHTYTEIQEQILLPDTKNTSFEVPILTVEEVTQTPEALEKPPTENVSKKQQKEKPAKKITSPKGTAFTVPFYSQFTDVTSAQWKKVSCGIASLAMLIEYSEPGALESVDALLQKGIKAHAYSDDVGWSYAGLIDVSKEYGLKGETHDYGQSSMDAAFSAFTKDLSVGPLMASVHYTFEPTNPIPHLVIINRITEDTVYYNDPAAKNGNGTISIEKFKGAWKKRYVEFRPLI